MTLKAIKEKLDAIDDIKKLKDEIEKILASNEVTEGKIAKYINKVKKYEKKIEKNKEMKMLENEFLFEKYDYVFGIDEVGRGPLAGPVVASCVMMKKESEILDVDDSKKLTENTREKLFELIKKDAKLYGIGMKDSSVIDSENILNATFMAMRDAYMEATKDIPETKKILVLIDGNLKNPLIKTDQMAVVKGDSKCYSIACASILAKVTRDRIMNDLDQIYPEYDFINNKGYGTQKHCDALKAYGKINGLHRESFIKKMI